MGRRKKFLFKEPRMLSARIEKEDLEKLNVILDGQMRTTQDFINDCVRQFISGSLIFCEQQKINTGENNE